MTNEKKKRSQFNFKLKENESDDFFKWFENQDNISNSLRSVLYHVIELYGTENFLEPSIQRQLYRDTFLLESLKNKEILSVNPETVESLAQNVEPENLEAEEFYVSEQIAADHEEKQEEEDSPIVEKPKKIDFKNINTDLL
ncbi:hypothetical protein [Peribacillus asahii]|uniref:hypothetical protein n=1 Tax=Peribacillus asahii TaxID=228899 RepID=UPI002079AEA3|nr:hypothetical protein [Peribacillus asahii]USK72624.1 hypothetical protein LIS76_23555 [Peribacillus asahii]USK72740.1 hypothetical protein LIS76_23735 [Peribacillus asahii]